MNYRSGKGPDQDNFEKRQGKVQGKSPNPFEKNSGKNLNPDNFEKLREKIKISKFEKTYQGKV